MKIPLIWIEKGDKYIVHCHYIMYIDEPIKQSSDNIQAKILCSREREGGGGEGREGGREEGREKEHVCLYLQ